MKNLMTVCVVVSLLLAASATAQCPDCADGVRTGGIGIQSLLGPTVPLSEVLRTWVEGDYVAAGAGLRGSASGTITISLPAGAVVQNAILYWSIMEKSATPSAALANVTFNSTAVVGTLVGTAGDPCWGVPPENTVDIEFIHAYVADVTAHAQDGANSVVLASIAGTRREGASLVVIYDNVPATAYKEVIIKHGAVTFAFPPTETTTFSGFNASGAAATTTWIVADGQSEAGLNNKIFDDGGEIANHVLIGSDPPAGNYMDTRTDTVGDASDGSVTLGIQSSSDAGNYDCLTWVAQVLSVAVEPTEVEIDIKPGSCPNPFNAKSKGVVPVAIVGTGDFDVTTVDLSTITLEGVSPVNAEPLDSTQPGGDNTDCYTCFEAPIDYAGDGYMDLVLYFDTQELADAIGEAERDDCVTLTLTGETNIGAPIVGSDSMVIKTKIK